MIEAYEQSNIQPTNQMNDLVVGSGGKSWGGGGWMFSVRVHIHIKYICHNDSGDGDGGVCFSLPFFLDVYTNFLFTYIYVCVCVFVLPHFH